MTSSEHPTTWSSPKPGECKHSTTQYLFKMPLVNIISLTGLSNGLFPSGIPTEIV